jgi:hypothetical protein
VETTLPLELIWKLCDVSSVMLEASNSLVTMTVLVEESFGKPLPSSSCQYLLIAIFPPQGGIPLRSVTACSTSLQIHTDKLTRVPRSSPPRSRQNLSVKSNQLANLRQHNLQHLSPRPSIGSSSICNLGTQRVACRHQQHDPRHRV